MSEDNTTDKMYLSLTQGNILQSHCTKDQQSFHTRNGLQSTELWGCVNPPELGIYILQGRIQEWFIEERTRCVGTRVDS